MRDKLIGRLQSVVRDIRRKPYPISDLIPLLTETIDHLSTTVDCQVVAYRWRWNENKPEWVEDDGEWGVMVEETVIHPDNEEFITVQPLCVAPYSLIDLQEEIKQLKKKLDAKQCEIDNLMLEYCPEEMTEEQLEEWGRNQVPFIN